MKRRKLTEQEELSCEIAAAAYDDQMHSHGEAGKMFADGYSSALQSLPTADDRNDLLVQIEKLQAFKDFVHRRLDEMDVPTHPEGEHSKAGCRIGDRLDIVQKRIAFYKSQSI